MTWRVDVYPLLPNTLAKVRSTYLCAVKRALTLQPGRMTIGLPKKNISSVDRDVLKFAIHD